MTKALGQAKLWTDARTGGVAATTMGAAPGELTETAFTVNPGSDAGTIVLVWTEPANTGGEDIEITGYDVQIWNSATLQWDPEASLGKVLTYTDKELPRGVRYFYSVRAKNAQGDGPWTAHKSNVVPATAPEAPDLTATAIGTNSIRLTWTVEDNGSAITRLPTAEVE